MRAPSKTDLVLGPAAGDDHRLDTGHLRQALGQQLAAGVELVLARAVAGLAGDQDDLGRVGGAAPGRPKHPTRPPGGAESAMAIRLFMSDLVEWE